MELKFKHERYVDDIDRDTSIAIRDFVQKKIDDGTDVKYIVTGLTATLAEAAINAAYYRMINIVELEGEIVSTLKSITRSIVKNNLEAIIARPFIKVDEDAKGKTKPEG